ncbi:MAG: hypothetical protein GWN02_23285, partial [Gemmatimonadetes bacterium]|nr:hypothetical protein [Gemmatimonadota bacterium]
MKYRDGVVPEADGSGLAQEIDHALSAVRESLSRYKVHEALAAAMDLARAANGYVEDRAPWAQAKDPGRSDALDETLATLARALVVLSALFKAVTPEAMESLAAGLGLDAVPTLDESVSMP